MPRGTYPIGVANKATINTDIVNGLKIGTATAVASGVVSFLVIGLTPFVGIPAILASMVLGTFLGINSSKEKRILENLVYDDSSGDYKVNENVKLPTDEPVEYVPIELTARERAHNSIKAVDSILKNGNPEEFKKLIRGLNTSVKKILKDIEDHDLSNPILTEFMHVQIPQYQKIVTQYDSTRRRLLDIADEEITDNVEDIDENMVAFLKNLVLHLETIKDTLFDDSTRQLSIDMEVMSSMIENTNDEAKREKERKGLGKIRD